MNPKIRASVLVVAIVVVCASVIGGVFWYRSRVLTPAALWKRLPAGDAVVFYIDFEALRRGGILQMFDNAKAPEDPEYLKFVEKTSFNYKKDLDAVMCAFGPSGRYILAKGRFDWKSLRTYAESEQGKCYNSLCRMTGSTPDRHISFLPIQSGLMALAVSTDDRAAMRLADAGSGPDAQIPEGPVWASVPPAFLRSAEGLPDGTRPFARVLTQAESVALSFVPDGSQFALKLTVNCHSDQDAYDAVSQLTKVTDLLRSMMEREHLKPGPGDFAGVLTSGKFWSKASHVYGSWPIERAVVENLLK